MPGEFLRGHPYCVAFRLVCLCPRGGRLHCHRPGLFVSLDDPFVTIRCPFADRYRNADSICGVAAAAGEQDKLDRYGSTVWPLSFESFGRLGADSITHLHNIAADFIQPGSRRTVAGVYTRLRYILEYFLLYEQADILLLSLGGSTGLKGWQGRHQRQLADGHSE